jgi:hypothetical protein
MLTFRINATKNFTEKELVRLEVCRVNLNTIFNSSIFETEFLKADFHGETSGWRNRSNQEILSHIKTGSETLSPEKDHEADIDLDIYYRNNRTVGYTYQHKMRQWINRKFFRSMSLWGVQGNIAHEWGHKMGFEHDYKKTKRRPFSVCYQINQLVRHCHLVLIDELDAPTALRKASTPIWKRALFFWRY